MYKIQLHMLAAHLPRAARRIHTAVHPVFRGERGSLDAYNALTATYAGAGGAGALAGWPVSIKENICMAGSAATCSSKMLLDFVPPFDAHVVALLRGAGAHIASRTNCDEFAMGGLNTHSVFGPVANPAVAGRSAGGSSGGAAAAVAAGLCRVSIGSDTGGSVRLPAAYCGVYGLKPSYGLVSRWGLVSYADSLDTIGVLARSIDDVRAAFDVIAKADARDATSRARPPTTAPDTLRGVRVGVPDELFPAELDAAAGDAVDDVLAALHALGAEIVRVSLPSVRRTLGAYYILALAEASSNLARYDGMQFGHFVDGADYHAAAAASRAGFGREVQKRILLGTHALSADAWDSYFLKAQRIRADIAREIDAAWTRADLLVHPTALGGAPRIDAGAPASESEYAQDVLTAVANLAGIPALSAPARRTAGGLPLGVSFAAPWGHEPLVFSTASRVAPYALAM